MSNQTLAPSFEKIVETSVQEAVTKILGDQVWKAVSFYFDPRQAANNPEAFASVLDKLFGNSSRVLQKVITDTLMRKVEGVSTLAQRQQGRDFRDWILIAQARFSSTLNHIGPH